MTQDLSADYYRVQRMLDEVESIVVAKSAAIRRELVKIRDKARSSAEASPKAVISTDLKISEAKENMNWALERLEQIEV